MNICTPHQEASVRRTKSWDIEILEVGVDQGCHAYKGLKKDMEARSPRSYYIEHKVEWRRRIHVKQLILLGLTL